MEGVRIAFVSREVYPFGGGGLGRFVTWAAEALSELAEVTILTTSAHERRFGELRAAGDPRLPAGVRFEFVPDVGSGDAGGFYGPFHAWSAAAFEALCELYPDGGPDLVEFPDFLGEGCVSAQASRTRDPRLRNTLVCVRTHGSAEFASVLDGHLPDEFEPSAMRELERYALRYADRVLWQGGDVLGTYHRYYGDGAIAPALRVRHPLPAAVAAPPPDERLDGRPLRLLYLGRLERRKGLFGLVDAVTSLGREDWSLTLVGEDTDTAPLGQSMRAHLELAAADDPRIRFEEPAAGEKVLRLLAEHDVLVMPSLWECWPYAALEALQHDRPVLATPTGGLVEIVKPGRSGWLAGDTTSAALAEALEAVLDAPHELRAMVDASAPRQVAAELSDVDEIREQYASLAREARGRRPARESRRDRAALVSVVVPYFQLERYVEETLRSLLEQTYSEVEIVLVNDGSLRPEDRFLLELGERYPLTLLTQPNSGLGAARNFGISQTRGSYVFPLDADNMALPKFVERCVEVLDDDPDVAFVTSWSRFVDEEGVPDEDPRAGHHPLGNSSALVERHNIAGDAAAVLRRRVFELGHRYSREVHSVEDWLFYRELHRAGLVGHVIPEALLEYRLRPDSMTSEVGVPELARLTGEMAAHLRGTAVRWTS